MKAYDTHDKFTWEFHGWKIRFKNQYVPIGSHMDWASVSFSLELWFPLCYCEKWGWEESGFDVSLLMLLGCCRNPRKLLFSFWQRCFSGSLAHKRASNEEADTKTTNSKKMCSFGILSFHSTQSSPVCFWKINFFNNYKHLTKTWMSGEIL